MLQKVTFTSNCHITWPDLIFTSWTRSVRLKNVEKRRKKNLTHFLLMFKCKMILNSSPGSSRINWFLSCVSDNKPVSRTLWLYVNIIFFKCRRVPHYSQHKEVDVDNRTQNWTVTPQPGVYFLIQPYWLTLGYVTVFVQW